MIVSVPRHRQQPYTFCHLTWQSYHPPPVLTHTKQTQRLLSLHLPDSSNYILLVKNIMSLFISYKIIRIILISVQFQFTISTVILIFNINNFMFSDIILHLFLHPLSWQHHNKQWSPCVYVTQWNKSAGKAAVPTIIKTRIICTVIERNFYSVSKLV